VDKTKPESCSQVTVCGEMSVKCIAQVGFKEGTVGQEEGQEPRWVRRRGRDSCVASWAGGGLPSPQLSHHYTFPDCSFHETVRESQYSWQENSLGWNTEERNGRKHQKMKRPPMFMDQQNWYYENVYITKNNLQLQCNPHKNSNDILHRNRKNNCIIHLDAQKTLET
jgi:hypothetical protein